MLTRYCARALRGKASERERLPFIYATGFHPLTLSRPGTEKGDFISVSHTRTYSVLTSQCYTGSLSDQAKWAQGSIESNLNARH